MTPDAYRVLAVEDDATWRRMLRQALDTLEGFEIVVDEVERAEEGLKAAIGGRYDLIIMDYELPDGDGIQAIENLRGRGVDAPIIMLTGEGDEDVAAQAIRSGADDYLTKDAASVQRIVQTTRNQLTIRDLDRQAGFLARHRDVDKIPSPERLALLGAFGATIQEGHRAGIADLTQIQRRLAERIRDLRDDPATEGARKQLESLQRTVDDLGDTIDRLDRLDGTLQSLRRLTLTRADRKTVDLDEMVGAAARIGATGATVEIETDLDGPDAIEVDPPAIRQIVIHLINNAIQADPEADAVTVRTRTDGDDAVIEVADRGPGVPDEIRERAFDLYVTTKEEHDGLGLPLVRSLVRSHGGTVAFRDREGDGTVFTVRLPRGAPASDS